MHHVLPSFLRALREGVEATRPPGVLRRAATLVARSTDEARASTRPSAP